MTARSIYELRRKWCGLGGFIAGLLAVFAIACAVTMTGLALAGVHFNY